jgi:excisionase family DNA binding protein
MIEPKRWLTAKETAVYLGIAPKSVYDLIAARKLPAARIGRLVRIDGKALLEDLEGQIQGGPAKVPPKGRRAK